MAFPLFILVNAWLFIRPEEMLLDLGVGLYQYTIIACMIVALPALLLHLRKRFPQTSPITTCVLSLTLMIPVSLMGNGLIEDAVMQGITFVKVVIYFLLLITLVSTQARLRSFLLWMGGFTAFLACIAMLQYYGGLDLAIPETGSKTVHGSYVQDKVIDRESGEVTVFNRMCGTGLFNDPNDLGLALVTGLLLSLYWLGERGLHGKRWFGLALLPLFGYALMLTQSRGAFLALLAGLGTLYGARYGRRAVVLVGIVLVPIMLLFFAGRMTDINVSQGTGQSRIQLWSDGLYYLRGSPIFGLGMDQFRHHNSHVAHNAFIHGFAELGLLGGTLFLGAFYFAVAGLYRLGSDPTVIEDETLRRLQPTMLAILVSYTVGIFFLSRTYVVPTYTILGLAVAYLRIVGPVALPTRSIAFLRRPTPRLAMVSVLFLTASYVLVSTMVVYR